MTRPTYSGACTYARNEKLMCTAPYQIKTKEIIKKDQPIKKTPRRGRTRRNYGTNLRDAKKVRGERIAEYMERFSNAYEVVRAICMRKLG